MNNLPFLCYLLFNFLEYHSFIVENRSANTLECEA